MNQTGICSAGSSRPLAGQGDDVADREPAQPEHAHGGDERDQDHHRLARPRRQCVEDRRHADVAAVPRRIADPGEGDQHDQDPVELFGEVDARLEHEPADDVGDGVQPPSAAPRARASPPRAGRWPCRSRRGRRGATRRSRDPSSGVVGLARSPGRVGRRRLNGVLPWWQAACEAPRRSRAAGAALTPAGGLDVGLHLVEDLLAAFAGHLDEGLLDLGGGGPERLPLLLGQDVDLHVGLGLLDLRQRLLLQALLVLDDVVERRRRRVPDQLLVLLATARRRSTCWPSPRW